MLVKTGKENMDVWYPQIMFQASDPLSHFILWQLHLNIYTLCFKMLVLAHLHRPVLTQQVQGKAIFHQVLAKLSPSFREKSPKSCKTKHTHETINTYLQCKFRNVYMNVRQNFRQKKKYFAFSEKTLAETVHYTPSGLRKGNPFHGPFAQLSYMHVMLLLLL